MQQCLKCPKNDQSPWTKAAFCSVSDWNMPKTSQDISKVAWHLNCANSLKAPKDNELQEGQVGLVPCVKEEPSLAQPQSGIERIETRQKEPVWFTFFLCPLLLWTCDFWQKVLAAWGSLDKRIFRSLCTRPPTVGRTCGKLGVLLLNLVFRCFSCTSWHFGLWLWWEARSTWSGKE